MGKQAAFGTSLQYVDPDDANDVVIHQIGDLSGPDVSVEPIDVTTHDSADRFSEFLPGMADGGPVDFELVFDPSATGHARILELVKQRDTIAFKLLLPDGASGFDFAGIFTKAGPTFPVKDAIRASVSIKVSGKPVFFLTGDEDSFDFIDGDPMTFIDGAEIGPIEP